MERSINIFGESKEEEQRTQTSQAPRNRLSHRLETLSFERRPDAKEKDKLQLIYFIKKK